MKKGLCAPMAFLLTCSVLLCSCNMSTELSGSTNAAKENNSTAVSELPESSGTQGFTLPSPTLTQSPSATEAPAPEPVTVTGNGSLLTQADSPTKSAVVKRSPASEYGAYTGTSATYTGLEPLPARSFAVTDAENTRALSTAAHNHSYGISKNGLPHDISVQNNKYYQEYGALTLDTSGAKKIYLTFDCGYENGYTGNILDTLAEKKVPAAFFVTLPYIESSPDITARMITDGHVVGNHSDNHPNFTTIKRTRMAKELQAVDDKLRMSFGYSSPFFRFPEGACSDCSLELVQSLGYTSVFWSSAYSDWDTNNQKGADYAYNTVTSRLHPGCILLLHAVSSDNAAALGRIIDYAKTEGYSFAALGE